MADYTSRHSGPNIDQGVQIALDWDPAIIGCKRVTSSMSAPLDMDTFFEPGSWIVDYYTNGPLNLLNYTPLPFSVAETYDGSTLSMVTQTVNVDQVKAYRNYTVATGTWTDWIEQGLPKVVVSTGTASNIVVTDSTVGVANLSEMTVQLNQTLNENATITVNGKGPYAILMPDGIGIAGGIFTAGSFIKIIYSSANQSFYMIATPIPNELAETLRDYGGRITGLETKTTTLETDLASTKQQVQKNTQDIADMAGGTGFAHSVDHSTDGQAGTAWTQITFNTEGVITKGEKATGENINLSSTDATTIAEAFDNIGKVVPTNPVTANRVIISDASGKMTAGDLTTEKLARVVLFEEASTAVDDLPE